MGYSDEHPESQLRPSIPVGGGLRVVVIGGGTGLSTLLKGLKQYAGPPGERPSDTVGKAEISDLCAVVTVSDHKVAETRHAFPDWLVAVSLVFNVLAAALLGRRRTAEVAKA